jgi:hypothetical protein
MRANDQRDRQLSDPDIHDFAQERWLGHTRIRQLVDEANDVAAGRAPVRSFARPVRWGVEDHARRHAAM